MAAITASAQVAPAPNIRIIEEIVAKVNGEIITRGELEEQYKEIEMGVSQSGLKGSARDDKIRDMKANVLRTQIDELLLVQKGKDLPGLTVDADVTKFFNSWQAQLKINDENKFHELLQQQFGRTFEEIKEQKKREILSQRVISYEVMAKHTVPEADLQKYYDDHKAQYVRDEEVFLSQILISTEGKSPEQVATAQQRATELVARARKGEKFSDLARDNSDDPETAQNGGYLGAPMKRTDLRPELAAIVFSDKAVKGYVTDPIKLDSPPGFLIIKVEEHYAAGQASFEEVRDEVQQAILGPKMEPWVREYLTQLREEAFLQIKDGYVDTGAAPGKDTRWQEVAQLKPATTTKEEVLSSSKAHKKVLGVSIPGTTAEVKTLAETEKPPKPPKHRAKQDIDPAARAAAEQAKEDSSPPMPPIKQ
ncbi:MAG TPA: peptidylprolyl isomerase [Bryobacteraceae bacterium]|nr:peptidylprolyl isomerase [Bryobacteraceae bacterium]